MTLLVALTAAALYLFVVVATFMHDAAPFAGALNTLLLIALTIVQAKTHRKVDDTRTEVQHNTEAIESTRATLAAPRRAIYDADGKVIGTVLELETGAPNPVVPPQRATDFDDRRNAP